MHPYPSHAAPSKPRHLRLDNFFLGLLFSSVAALFATAAAHAQTTIDQGSAEAGNVLPGDAPGFPVTINQRGSYKLTGNLVVPAGVSGIVVTASDVQIDLNGYAIHGPIAYCTGVGATVVCPKGGSGSGIEAGAGASNVQVHNGSIAGFAVSAVALNERSSVDRLKTYYNGAYAIVVGADSSVSHSVARFNGFGGIFAYGGTISESLADGNRYYGIVMLSASGGLVSNSIAQRNGVYGLTSLGAMNATFMDNQSNANGSTAIAGGLLLANVCNNTAWC